MALPFTYRPNLRSQSVTSSFQFLFREFKLFLDPYYQRSSVSKLCIHQTAAAEVHGGLFDALYLHDLQSLLAQKPQEQNNQQVHGGRHILGDVDAERALNLFYLHWRCQIGTSNPPSLF